MEEEILSDLAHRNVNMALKEELISVCAITNRNLFIYLQVDRPQRVKKKNVALTFLESVRKVFWHLALNLLIFSFLTIRQFFEFKRLFFDVRHRALTVV